MRFFIGILFVLGFSFGSSLTFYYISYKHGLLSILKTFLFCIMTILFTCVSQKLVNTYIVPLEKEEYLKNIEFFLEKENNKNKDLILEILKEKDKHFLKKYYNKKFLEI